MSLRRVWSEAEGQMIWLDDGLEEPPAETFRCDLCQIFAADGVTDDGRAVCSRCAHTLDPARKFATTRDRFHWFMAEYHTNEALPLWWVCWRFLQVEIKMLRP